MRFPANQAEWILFVKSNYWTISLTFLVLLICWQGLTLYLQMQSWSGLERRADAMLDESVPSAGTETPSGEGETPGRTIEATFFHHPKPQYNLTAILGDYVVIDGKEVKAGGRIDKATLESIEANGIIIKEDGSAAPRQILLHPGPEEKKGTGSTDSTGRNRRSRK